MAFGWETIESHEPPPILIGNELTINLTIVPLFHSVGDD